MKYMTFSQKKIARTALFISEAQERYVRTVDELMELKRKMDKLERKLEHYDRSYDKLLNDNDMICERFSKSRGSRYRREIVVAKYGNHGKFDYSISSIKK